MLHILHIQRNLTVLLLITISLALFNTAFAQEEMTTEERLVRLEKAVTNITITITSKDGDVKVYEESRFFKGR